MSDVEYREPQTLQEVYEALNRFGEDARLLAGGTALVNLIKQRLVQPGCLIGLRRVAGLADIAARDSLLRLGGMTSHRDVETSPLVSRRYPLLAEAYRRVATVRIRNVATVGGGLAHADPNQDPPVALLALDARAVASSAKGEREMPLASFFRDYFENALEPGEVLTGVLVPAAPEGAGNAYLKFLPRTQDDYATVSVAALVQLGPGGTCRDVRIALGSVAPTPVRAAAAETLLRGQAPTADALLAAAEAVAEVLDPITDYRGSAEYKRAMAVVFTRRALEQALARARPS